MAGIMDHLTHYEEALPAFDACLSTEEKAMLSDLSVNPSQIQQWAVLKIDEYTNRIRSLKSVYNAGALVNRTLPREVLGEIFANLHHREESRDVELRYLHVCRLWRHLILFGQVNCRCISKCELMLHIGPKTCPIPQNHPPDPPNFF